MAAEMVNSTAKIQIRVFFVCMVSLFMVQKLIIVFLITVYDNKYDTFQLVVGLSACG
jgi:hypothetical protein